MSEGLWNQVNARAFKEGQRNAIDRIFMWVRDGMRYIPIVLPPGYGKSDVIRVATIMLMQYRLACRAIILEPAENLRAQIINNASMHETADRYKLPYGLHRTWEAKSAITLPWPPGRNRDASFIAMTIQLASGPYNRVTLAQWVADQEAKNGAPVVVFIDEAHTASDQNSWGATAQALGDAGAIIVLLTGTPYRADKRPIAGFKVDPVRVDPVRIQTRVAEGGQQLVNIHEGHKVIGRLRVAYEHTLHDAWNVDSPPSLCKLTRIPLDFDLYTHDRLTGEARPNTALSAVQPNRIRGQLSRLLRNSHVVEVACKVFLRELYLKQKATRQAAGIIFVGNNDNAEVDPMEREQALKVEDTLRKLAPFSLKVKVATNDQAAEAHRALKEFQDGDGDVLIVKQMGSLGYDAPRLKVGLDLSLYRQAASYVQRVMRLGRVWKYGPGEKDVMMQAVYITPDDMKGLALWNNFISGEGGDTELTNTELVETLIAQEHDGEEATPAPQDYYTVADVRLADYSDTDGVQAAAETKPEVERVIEAWPPIQNAGSQPVIAEAIPALRKALMPEGQVATAPPAPEAPAARAQFVDGVAERRDGQERINEAARQIAGKRLGRRYIPGDKEYGRIISYVQTDHKRKLGIAHKKPDDYTAREAEALLASMMEELGDG